MGPLEAAVAVAGIYTSMLWLTGRRLKQATEAFLRREAELDRRDAELMQKLHRSERPMEF